MPRERDWESLSPRTRKSYTGTGKNRYGWSESQVRSFYESGSDLKDLRRQTVSAAFRQSPSARELNVLAWDGQIISVPGLSKAEASLVGQHWNAVTRYVNTGSGADWTNTKGTRSRGLDYFEGKTVNGIELESRRGAILMLASTQEIDLIFASSQDV